MKRPNVSVIIPVYNGERYLKETIESVLNQTDQNFELIIVDDASTDGSYKIIKAFHQKHPDKIKIIKHSKNKGCPAASRNTGIKIAKGRYIALMDQDDMWLPKKLEEQLKVIEKSSKIGLVATNARVYDHHKKQYLGHNWKNIKNLSLLNKTERLLKENFILTGSMALIRKEFFDQYGLLDENFKIADDYDLWFRISQHYQIRLTQQPLVTWRKTGTSTSFNEKNLLNDMVYFYEKRKKEGFVSHKLGHFYVRLANLYLAENNPQQAKQYYQKASNEGYHNIKISLVKFLLAVSPTLAHKVVKNKRNASQKIDSFKDSFSGCKEINK